MGSTVALLSTHSTSSHETVTNKAQLLCCPKILAVFYSLVKHIFHGVVGKFVRVFGWSGNIFLFPLSFITKA